MKRVVGWIACVAVATSLSACGGSGGESPEEAFRMMKQALAAKDYDQVIDLMSKGDQEKLREERNANITAIKKSIKSMTKANKAGTMKMLEDVYDVSLDEDDDKGLRERERILIEDLEKIPVREFIILKAKHADKTGKGTGLLTKMAKEFVEWEFVKTEMGKRKKTAVLIVKNKNEDKKSRIHAVLEDDGWKVDFSKK